MIFSRIRRAFDNLERIAKALESLMLSSQEEGTSIALLEKALQRAEAFTTKSQELAASAIRVMDALENKLVVRDAPQKKDQP